MKTIEQKAKAYDMALEAARKELGVDRKEWEVVQRVLHSIFPELRESEDERIRKQLIAIMNFLGRDNAIFSEGQITKEQAIAYLEKQKEYVPENEESGTRKEQKPIEFKNDELVEIIKGEFEGFRRLLKKKGIDYEPQYGYWEGFARLFDSSAREYVKEQKPAVPPYIDFVIKPHKGDADNPYDMGVSEAQEYAIKRGFGIPFNDGEVFVDERYITQTIGNILRWADEHPKEQKPTSFNEPYNPDEYEVVMEGNATSLKRKEQKPVEWSEEDIEAFVKSYSDSLPMCGEFQSYHDALVHAYRQGVVNTLKSLRPSWKPSEEDIKMLEHIIGQYETGNKNSKVMGYLPRVEELSFLKKVLSKWKN